MRGGWGRKAAVCGLPRFLRPLSRSQRLRGGVRWGVGGMPRFATCRVSCGLWAARNACVGGVRWGVRCMPRFAACRVSCGLGPLATLTGWGALGRGVHAALCGMPRFLRPLGRSQRLLFVLRHRFLGRCPKPRQGPEAPAPHSFIPPYRTTRFLSLRKSSVTPSGGSPNVALSVLLPPSHVSCIAISLASIRQPSSTTVTTSPTS